MYQKAGQLFKTVNQNEETQKPIKHECLSYTENFTSNTLSSSVRKNMVENLLNTVDSQNIIKEKEKNKDIYYLRDPEVWGPIFWFSLHNGASKYSDNPSNHMKEKLKGFILGIPYMIPCKECSDHARDYIDKHKDNLDNILKNNESFFKFTYDFHDNANKIIGNERITLEEAKNIYYDD